MSTYIIKDKNIIKKLTGKEIYNRILLHIDLVEKTAKYESDYTLYELTERLKYNSAIKILKDENIII
ncbi:MAG: hypothetical protein PHO63_00380 [Bacilli bacterium]|nr:hypothetical protein [Bacilli bacterium]MDD4808674.1 hypothetical protein [Bacilli bacterium]